MVLEIPVFNSEIIYCKVYLHRSVWKIRCFLCLNSLQNASINSQVCDFHVYISLHPWQSKGGRSLLKKVFQTLFFLPSILAWLKRNFVRQIYAGIKSKAECISWPFKNDFSLFQTSRRLKKWTRLKRKLKLQQKGLWEVLKQFPKVSPHSLIQSLTVKWAEINTAKQGSKLQSLTGEGNLLSFDTPKQIVSLKTWRHLTPSISYFAAWNTYFV